MVGETVSSDKFAAAITFPSIQGALSGEDIGPPKLLVETKREFGRGNQESRQGGSRGASQSDTGEQGAHVIPSLREDEELIWPVITLLPAA